MVKYEKNPKNIHWFFPMILKENYYKPSLPAAKERTTQKKGEAEERGDEGRREVGNGDYLPLII